MSTIVTSVLASGSIFKIRPTGTSNRYITIETVMALRWFCVKLKTGMLQDPVALPSQYLIWSLGEMSAGHLKRIT